jgi:hypothetical protein
MAAIVFQTAYDYSNNAKKETPAKVEKKSGSKILKFGLIAAVVAGGLYLLRKKGK